MEPVEKRERQSEPKKRQQFLIRNIIRGLLWLLAIVVAFVVAKKYISQYYLDWLMPLTSRPVLMYLVFLVSETFIGIFPPEFFMIWALDSGLIGYIEKLILLTAISYAGGLIAFGIGKWLKNTIYVNRLTKRNKAKKYIAYYQEYGGFLIILAAVTPLPFALISTISGSLGFSFFKFLQFASARLIRFAIYGWIIWQVNMI